MTVWLGSPSRRPVRRENVQLWATA